MDSALVDLSDAQSGVVTTRQLKQLGHTRKSIAGLVRDGTLVRLTRGAYAACVPPEGPSRTVEWHRLLGRAAQLLYPDGALAGHSAMVALDLPVWGSTLTRVHLERPIRREVLTRDLVIRPPFRDSAAPPGVVPVAQGLVQHCMENGATPGIVAADAALRESVVTQSDLAEAAAVVKGWPRSSRVRTMLALVDGRSESVGESRLRVGLTLLGVLVEPQVVIRDERGRFVARVDFLVKDTKVVIEFDGLVKYRDGGAEALIAEKRREDELRRLGHHVVRVVWADLENLGALVARLRSLGVVCHRGIPQVVRDGASPSKGRLHPETVPG